MYHSVRPDRNPGWIYSHLTLDISFFEKQLDYLRRHGYYVASLPEVVAFKRGRLKLPEKTVSLTFDDGYLDNWVFAFPLLRKYGYRATVFVCPEFVEQKSTIRPSLCDYWDNKSGLNELPRDGFMSWEELRLLQNSGLVAVESHTMTHTFYPVSDRIIDFYHPGSQNVWIVWNIDPRKKPFYMNRENEFIFGAPVYEFDKAIVAQRVTEDGSLTDYLFEYVHDNRGKRFFADPEWRKKLFDKADTFRARSFVHYIYESDSEYRKRIMYELSESKKTIENEINKSVEFLSWPNGGWNENTHAMALQAGYEATTAKGSLNVFNSHDPTRISRMGLHQVGQSKIISRLFVTYALNAHRQVWPYAQLRWVLARAGATPLLKNIFYRGQ